jgi:VanZ family protein
MLSSVHTRQAAGKGPSTQVSVAYGVLLAAAFLVYHFVANGEFSAILTMAVMAQCLAVALLGLQILSSGTAAGISARALALEALSFSCRLSSTTWLNGYLPVDASGDFVYQLVDVLSLLMVLGLIYHVLVTYRRTYQEDMDSLPVLPVVLGAFVLAAIFHADMNSRPLFDALWMAGLFVGVFSVLPQLTMVARSGGVVDALTSHYIAMMAVSRILSGTFMWHARFDVTCAPWIEGVDHAIWAILLAHAVHLLLLGDFAFYYVRAICSQGLACKVDLQAALDIV